MNVHENKKWSERHDSNMRPLPPQGSALPNWATSRRLLHEIGYTVWGYLSRWMKSVQGSPWGVPLIVGESSARTRNKEWWCGAWRRLGDDTPVSSSRAQPRDLSWETLIKSLSDFILGFLYRARNHLTRIASYLRKMMTKLCIKIHMKSGSAI